MNADWVVLLEAEREDDAVLGIERLEQLLEALACHSPHALYSVDRYAIQLVMVAPSPAAALRAATGEWRRATSELHLPAWPVVRAEVKTPAELQAEHRAGADSLDGPTSSAGAPTSEEALRASYEATRQLLSAGSRADAAAIVIALAERLGATLVPPGAHHADAMPVDLSLGEGGPLWPAADPISMARLQLEEVLPTVVADANRVVALLESTRPAAVGHPKV